MNRPIRKYPFLKSIDLEKSGVLTIDLIHKARERIRRCAVTQCNCPSDTLPEDCPHDPDLEELGSGVLEMNHNGEVVVEGCLLPDGFQGRKVTVYVK
jgi:hypothetical protein